MIRTSILLLCGMCLFFSCKKDTSSKSDYVKPKTNASAASSTVTTPTTDPANAPYPPKPAEQLREIFNNADFLDFTFYQLPVSMSFDNQRSIQQVVRYLTVNPPASVENCKGMGRAYFQKQGEDLAIAEFSFQEGCNYFLFYENNKPVYANILIPEGVDWFKQSITQAYQQARGQSGN